MTEFTPGSALAGGLMIGASASLLLIFNGRIAGISGIVAGLFQRDLLEVSWRVAFVVGVLLAPFLYGVIFGSLPPVAFDASAGVIVVAGLFVGFGTRLGSGCTSGHGVCGLSRGSPRSLLATGVFMFTAVVTVLVTRHLIGQ
ncbi:MULTISPECIES: YeeE/YedE family protein [unclassified Bradyrhizobium]|uniref:YeeE/YedE family protein n=1 Tax=unclassified Bradyrhizobium TaxID=2631580 RepID=UPI001BA6FAA6|nr:MULTISPECIES: YeeE/YedE family protein [unclassified Bradyrhizobium]MBR1208161.1 YeeE/YedE family protein [Bradyrhizobium sp. AUGA SZCCT0124]MBR1316430.1 YeeE/YedE family protein [Bradyrhizobium sp. AUGA SZCCT0051]MBR1344675.1 YeeE/YedE family protein [Bradyrhizobium sp. AUGA SZCCT0105]MBR1359451.1 YeeE/YedE family protein [Bradyrhizobium sp. AUGA SZCCT0045]